MVCDVDFKFGCMLFHFCEYRVKKPPLPTLSHIPSKKTISLRCYFCFFNWWRFALEWMV